MKYFLTFRLFPVALLLILCPKVFSQDYRIRCQNIPEDEVPTIRARQLKSCDDIRIDGKGSETFWKKCQSYPIGKSIGKQPPAGKEDFRATFRMAWDSINLYALVEVEDDFYVTLDQRPDCKTWQNDCIEFFVNPDNRTEGECPFLSSLGKDGSEIHANPGDDKIIRNNLAGEGYCHTLSPVAGYRYKSQRTRNGYTMEVQMPFSMFSDSLAYLVGQVKHEEPVKFGFDVNACDADDVNAKCSQLRQHIMSWASDTTDNFMNTGRYGFVKLEEWDSTDEFSGQSQRSDIRHLI